MKKIKSTIILSVLRVLDFKLSSKWKNRLSTILLGILGALFIIFLAFNLVQSHKEGERDTRVSQVAKDTKSVVSNYSKTSFATTHLTLTSSQWLSKENNFDYSLAKTYTTYLASVDDDISANKAYKAIPWASDEIGLPLLSYSNPIGKGNNRIISLKSLSRQYGKSDMDRWVAIFDTTMVNRVGTRVESLIKVEIIVKEGKVSYWNLEHGGFK